MLDSEFNYIFLNEKWANPHDFNPTNFSKGVTIYEVIRVIEGIPLFLEEHLIRLESSAQQMNIKLWHSINQVKNTIHQLINKNEIQNGNIQILFNIQTSTALKQTVYQFIPSHYPVKSTYQKGVKCMLFSAERNQPGIKKTDLTLRESANQAIKKNKVFEVILIDRASNMGEGSRSNVFFIKDEIIFTAPNNKVLAGVTRQRILKICAKAEIKLIERNIHINELTQFDAAFLTGTSPKVLPISDIGSLAFNPANELLQKLIRLYDAEINSYLEKVKFN